MADEEDKEENTAICDRKFLAYVDRLIELRDFISREAVDIGDHVDINISRLATLHYNERGRRPSAEEWDTIDSKTKAMYATLDLASRRKFYVVCSASANRMAAGGVSCCSTIGFVLCALCFML
jgi:hypothetical protein